MVELLQRMNMSHSITPLPRLIASLLLGCTAITKCAQPPPSSNKKWEVVYFLEPSQRRGREREEKEAKDRFKEPAGVHALPNGISALHPTALPWPLPSPARSNFPAACLLPRRASLVLQPAIPGHQKDQICAA